MVKVGAIDMDTHKSVGSEYQVTGFPTIKVFGGNKKSPSAYNGGRTATDLVDAAINELKAVARSRLGIKKKDSASSSSKPKAEGSKEGSKKGGKSAVVELTESNFDELVLQSDEPWLVEFFAPWCGHCKNLAPNWEKAAGELDGKVKLGAVDATVHGSLASKYGVKGYPTIKAFKAGPKTEPTEYDGGRGANDIVQWAMSKLYEERRPPPEVQELVSEQVFKDTCGSTSICIITWLPHILDSKAEGREQYLTILRTLASKFKAKPVQWVWAEAGKQQSLAQALDVGGSGYPAVAAINAKKLRSATLVGTLTEQAVGDFMTQALRGSLKTVKIPPTAIQKIDTTEPWDGKDGKDEL